MVIMIVGHAICSSTQASHCGEHFASQTMRSRTPPARGSPGSRSCPLYQDLR
jgi:hypothetical protein